MLSTGARRAQRLAAAPRWIVARAALRIVLAGHLGLHPGDVEFATGEHGKPEILGSALRFNLSHSADLALIALTEHAEVGIDVEHTSRRSRAVERTLTPPSAPPSTVDDRHTELLRIWCRKEALAKAGGGGLGWAPETFDTPQPGDVLTVRSRTRRRLRRRARRARRDPPSHVPLALGCAGAGS